MASIEPTETQMAALLSAAAESDAPVVMVNLLQFGPGGDKSYHRYAEEVKPFLESVGATVLYAGDASHVVVGDIDKPWWDAILVVRYPSRAAFLAMAGNSDYHEKANAHRVAALESTHLIATDPWKVSR
ncbi:DUF1330 domain-containing protein [Mycobacterium sp. E796]|uniref:DUF1330 domain-containing protein n=1 Tax=Mycobacterium sp. E796 TaxID=1834151 RepID=UPI0008005A72|nr:DUF1330 domain-containing protein [Mycobacterium sp. E796]OBI42332.1 hypothetical protein A5706_06735 [Mycobacterium sp. E796]